MVGFDEYIRFKQVEQTTNKGTVFMSEFSKSMAFIIGINNYTNGISPLQNAVNDAKKLIEILREKHEYKVWVCLDEVATLNNLNELLEKILPEEVSENDRLLFYFAGHGIALNGDDGPEGYLIPQDAKLGDVQTYLPMTKLQESLSKLPCRHFLGILDCCFSGAFRWSSNRDLLTAPEVIHKERYDRFITDPAWQVITSAASDQKALDAFALNSERRQGGIHSPFAAALIEALAGKADIYPAPPGDGVITAQELYVYLRDEVELATEGNGQRQTPGIWPLKKHDKGEYIFLSPGHPLNLPPAPPLDTSKNPYRGLESYDEEHSELFFGRTELVEKLHNFVKTHPLTVVLGASGSGKSSLVKAGLIPELRQDNTEQWCILPLIRPGETPLQALNNALKNAQLPEVAAQDIEQSLAMSIDTWAKNHPKIKLLLFIDQSEEIITLCQNEDERKEFFQQILKAINVHRDRLRVVLSLRSDFEPQIREAGLKFVDRTVNNLENTVLESRWYIGRFIIPAMTRGELRQAIEKPAETRVMYFQPHELVEQLIDEVADMPGALPLLSFALSELYLKYLKRQWDAQNEGRTIDRALTQEDYQDLGGVIQSLTKRADEEYETLVKENPAYTQIIRHVMLRMIALGGGELARRRVPLSELEYPPEKNSFVTAVIERFTKARLLVKGDDADGNPYVEPAHDALVRGWQKLLMWKQEEQESLVLQQRLTPAATEWDSIKKKDKEQPKGILDRAVPIWDLLDRKLLSLENFVTKIPIQLLRLLRRPQNQQEQSREKPVQFLWNANPYLEVLNKELNSDDNWLNQVEAEFVQQSVLRKRRNIRMRRRGAIAVILGLSSLTILTLIGQRNALIGQINASQEASEANLLANKGLDSLISSLQAIKDIKELDQKYFLWQNTELRNKVIGTLRSVIYTSREINQWTEIERNQGVVTYGKSTTIAFNSQGQLFLAQRDKDGGIILRNLSQNTSIMLGEDKDSFINCGIAFSKDARLVASAYKKGNIIVRDLNGKKITEFFTKFTNQEDKDEGCPNLVFSPDGKQLAIGESYINKNDNISNNISLWDLSGDKPIKKQPSKKFEYEGYGFNSNNQLVVSQNILDKKNASWYLFDFLSGNKITEIKVDSENSGDYGLESKATNLIFSPDDSKLIICNQLLNISKVDSDTDGIHKNLSASFKKRISVINFSPDGQQIIQKNEDNNYTTMKITRIDNWNSEDSKSKILKGHKEDIFRVAFSSDGRQLASIGTTDKTLRLWDLSEKSIVSVQNPLSKPVLMNGEQNSINKNFKVEWQRQRSDEGGSYGSYYVRDKLGNLLFTPDDKFIDDNNKFNFNPDGNLFVVVDFNDLWLWDFSGRLLFESEFDNKTDSLEKGERCKKPEFSDDGGLLVIVNCSDPDKPTPFKSFKLETSDELIVRGCNLVRDYLQKNPKVSDSDRHLCDDVLPTAANPNN